MSIFLEYSFLLRKPLSKPRGFTVFLCVLALCVYSNSLKCWVPLIFISHLIRFVSFIIYLIYLHCSQAWLAPCLPAFLRLLGEPWYSSASASSAGQVNHSYATDTWMSSAHSCFVCFAGCVSIRFLSMAFNSIRFDLVMRTVFTLILLPSRNGNAALRGTDSSISRNITYTYVWAIFSLPARKC